MSRRMWFFFIAMLGSGFGVYYVISAGWYPAAVVNSSVITAHTLDRETAAAFEYYTKTVKKTATDDPRSVVRSLRAAVLDQLIEEALVYRAVRERLPDTELASLVDAKINATEFEKSTDIEGKISALYGMNKKEFKELVLIPIVERAILEEQLQKESRDLSGWISSARREARVFVVASHVSWDGERIQER